MGINKYQPHVFVLPEDDANRQIANGFLLDLNLNSCAIQVLPEARGWEDVVEKFTNDYASTMRQFLKRTIVLLIDFDEDEDRLIYVKHQIPEDLIDRVFVIGVLSEPEKLRKDINKNFEKIGEALAKDCSNNTDKLWGHNLLKHNKTELDRMILSVKPFLFNLQ
ncbi:hypothetical protein FNW02_28220 [Komarekiella sp. 'clone 1']|uniref:Uncharacterized protein n=1 Tax=Komarekiella delphini-convector SJRDD-AB1 TaxID=2593771 RepID=A0AA40T2R7_9NOST|nr:hypothetical protein [Komarekiella delphini-convector]MBD6619600.1 hypothetical protein [Komarekiella delphini-convector SJRDD-AB1]